MRTTNRKIESTGQLIPGDWIVDLILGEIKLWNLKNLHFEKKSPESLKKKHNRFTTLNNVEIGFEQKGCLRQL